MTFRFRFRECFTTRFSPWSTDQVSETETKERKAMIISDPRVHADYLEEKGKLKAAAILRKLIDLHPGKATSTLLGKVQKLMKRVNWQTDKQSISMMIYWLGCTGELDLHRCQVFACWCAQQVRELLDAESLPVLEVLERNMQGQATKEELDTACETAYKRWNIARGKLPQGYAQETLWRATMVDMTQSACWAAMASEDAGCSLKSQCDKIRELWHDSVLTLTDRLRSPD
jgi:hypothetical protein